MNAQIKANYKTKLNCANLIACPECTAYAACKLHIEVKKLRKRYRKARREQRKAPLKPLTEF